MFLLVQQKAAPELWLGKLPPCLLRKNEKGMYFKPANVIVIIIIKSVGLIIRTHIGKKHRRVKENIR